MRVKRLLLRFPDPGTYDAQTKKTGVFSLKSATVPATSSSGLYTWAFHHGNFDNAYGDGDILTARENGRFYADTPAYTGDIGTITPRYIISYMNFHCTVQVQVRYNWNGTVTCNIQSGHLTDNIFR